MTTTATHTPGPWACEWETENDPIIVGGKNRSQLVCTLPNERSEDGHDEAIRDANARLIVASPDLFCVLSATLPLLRLLDAKLGGSGPVEATINAAEVAIRKATGEAK